MDKIRKGARTIILGVILAGLLSLILAQTALAQKEHGHESGPGTSKVAEGIKATFKVTPANSMVDLYLADSAAGKEITKAKVSAVAKGPDGKTQEKELIGMKMDKDYSFGNTFDFSQKGNYSFDLTVEVDKKKVKFDFKYVVK